MEQLIKSATAPAMIPGTTRTPVTTIPLHPAIKGGGKTLLMTCDVLVDSPCGVIQARALLDSGSSMSFITELLARTLSLPHSKFAVTISGIAGMTKDTSLQSLTTFKATPVHNVHKKFDVEAVVIPCIICQLPVQLVHSLPHWKHLNDVILADPNYGVPQ